jgi:formylmethanofuran dehydrogenase subunit D
MKHIDYDWDLKPDKIILDRELNIDRLGWKAGDCFKITNQNGQIILIKMEEVEQFMKGHKVNG